MAIQVIRCDVCTTKVAKHAVDIFLSHKELIDYSSPGRVVCGNHVKIKVLKADRNVVAEAFFSNCPVPLIVKFPNGNKIKARKALAWETEQWKFVDSALKWASGSHIPAIIAFDEASSSLFLEKLQGRTVWKTMLRSPFVNLSGRSKQRTLAQFWKLGKILATLHDKTASQPGPLFYNLETKFDLVDRKLFQDPIFNEGYGIFRQFYSSALSPNWVHGNLRTDNILFTREGVALIDFENAGAGDPTEDIARLLAFIIMFRRSSIFPRCFWSAMVENLLKGYGEAAKYSAQRLVACVLGEMLCTYGRNFASEKLSILDRRSKQIVAENITHLTTLLNERPDAFTACPSLLIPY